MLSSKKRRGSTLRFFVFGNATVKRQLYGERRRSVSDGRNANGRFAKGNKLGGRKREPKEFKQRAIALSDKALDRFAEILDDPLSDPKDVIAVGKIIIERAYGKPHIETNDDGASELAKIDKLIAEVTDAAKS
jgi:hypothetical protein